MQARTAIICRNTYKNMTQKASLSKNVLLGMVSLFLLHLVSIVKQSALTNLLPISEYGVLTAYSTWLSFSVVCVGLQLHGSLNNARIDYENQSALKKYHSSVIFLALLSFACFFVLFLIFSRPLSLIFGISAPLTRIMLPHAFGSFCTAFLITKYISEKKATSHLIISFSVAVLVCLSSIGFAIKSKDYPVNGAIFGEALIYILFGVGVLTFLFFQGKSFINYADWRYATKLSLPLIVHGLSRLLLSQSARIMLQRFSGESVLGIYGYTNTISNILLSFWDAINTAFVPFYFGYLSEGNREELSAKSKGFDRTVQCGAVGFLMIVPEIVKILSPPEYWVGFRLFPVFVAIVYVNHMYGFCINYETYHKRTGLMAIASLAAGLVNVAVSLFLIPAWGATGAAISTLISYICLFFAHYWIVKSKIGNFPLRLRFFLPGVSVVIIASVLYLIFLDNLPIRWSIMAIAAGYMLRKLIKERSII